MRGKRDTQPPMFFAINVEDRIRRETKFDSDLWLIESDDRQGRHFLDLAPQDEAP